MKNVFVTGATGFLGAHLCRQLSEQGVTIYAIKRASSSIRYVKDLPIQWHEGDVLQPESLDAACPEHVDAIFHIAADTSMWSANNTRQTQVNCVGTQNLIDLALEKNAQKFILTSSIAAYGTHRSVLTEATPQLGYQSISNYYRTKYESELMVKQAIEKKGLPAIILNPCHLVGAYDDQNWSQMIQLVKQNKLPGIPPGMGSFCDIEEVASAHIQAVLRGRVGENYILSGYDASFIEFVREIGQLTGRKIQRKATPKFVLMSLGYLSYWVSLMTHKEPTVTPEKAMIVSEKLRVSSAKAQQELGYRADIPLATQLAKCVQWMAQVGRL